MTSRQAESRLAESSRAVERRLALAACCEAASRSCVPTFVAFSGLGGLVAWWRGALPGLVFALGAAALWFVALAAWAWWKRPRGSQALAVWDRQAERHEMFLSAYCFEQLSDRTPGQEAHLRRALAALEVERPNLRRQLPIAWTHRSWLVPLVFVVGWQFVDLRAKPVEAGPTETIDDEARRNAAELSKTLAKDVESLKPDASLEEKEREQVDALKKSIQETAEKLKDLKDATPREALTELEQRARAAESLADSLSGGSQKLSEEMLDEMARHADTADLADALRADDAEQIANEASKLADKINQSDASLEEKKRVADAFKKTMDAANANDKKTDVGKKLEEVNEELRKRKQGLASKKLKELADAKRKQQQRRQSTQQLQQLAKNLRKSGQQIFGRNTTGLQRLQQNQQQQQQAGGPQKVGTPKQIPLAQLQPAGPQGNNPQGSQQARMMIPTPGQQGGQQAGQQGGQQGQQGRQGGQQQGLQLGGQQPGGQQGQIAGVVPIPGSGQQPGAGQQPGVGQQVGAGQGAGQPVGAIPIPGTGGMHGAGQQAGLQGSGSQGSGSQGSGSQGSGSQAGSGSGSGSGSASPSAGGQGGSGQASGGGLQAGTGTAPLGNEPVTPLEAKRRGTVNAQVGEQGSSQQRAVAPRSHEEQAQVAARRSAVEFIKVQEEALADEPLPASRREQVRRYFNSLRQQLAAEAPAGGANKESATPVTEK